MAIDLSYIGIESPVKIFRNLTKPQLMEESIRRHEGLLSKDGAFIANTGKYTGRSPNDKFTVKDENSANTVWWGTHNKPMAPETALNLYDKISTYLAEKELFVQDCYAGACQDSRLAVRVVSERAWHSSFAQNMFLQPTTEELSNFAPDFTVMHAPGLKAEPETDGTNSEAAIVVDFSRKRVLICGSEYAGEIKKSIFGIMNYILPTKEIMGMHCSANKSASGETALFFGLSGTGKTTLSADPNRNLIGDDEHGWSNEGIFNFEGGCYAKVIKLSAKDEPEIYATTKKFGTILENVVVNDDRTLDLDSAKFTENTRASYDITAIPNVDLSGKGEHPKHIVMLTCDAFGVLPPIAKMTPAQAMYHFLSGYTAKVAGTERGITEPVATFSSCFGAPFMPRHPSVYAKLLGKKIENHNAQCWLVNTGWTKGPYGTGERMKIKWTRDLLNAALRGDLNNAEFEAHPIFKVLVPKSVDGVPAEVLNPKDTWEDKAAYDEKARHLADLFQVNFRTFLEHVEKEVVEAQPGY